MLCLNPFMVCPLKVRNLFESAQRAEHRQIDHAIALGRLLDFVIAAVYSLAGMAHDAGTHHVQIDIHEATMKVGIGFDGCGVIAIFPEGALARLPSVVLLCSLTRDELDAARNDTLIGVLYEQVNMIGRDHVIQHAQPESLARLEEPAQVSVSIVGKLQEKISLVAAMSQMPDMAGQEMAVGSWHRFTPLKRAFYYRKDASKR